MPTYKIAFPLRRLFTVRRLRLTTGLVLLAYVTCHLINLSLGNVSLAAAEAYLTCVTLLWHSESGTILLGAAFAVHISFGLWALYERRHYQWRMAEVVQLVTGLAIPALLMNHVFVTRIAELQFGLLKGYTQEFNTLYGDMGGWGAVQVVVLIVAWLHGSLGIHFWLRLKSFYRAVAPWLLGIACMLPAIALLGFYHGGETVMSLRQDAAWRAANLDVTHVGTPADVAALIQERWICLAAYAGAILLIFVARGIRVWRE